MRDQTTKDQLQCTVPLGPIETFKLDRFLFEAAVLQCTVPLGPIETWPLFFSRHKSKQAVAMYGPFGTD